MSLFNNNVPTNLVAGQSTSNVADLLDTNWQTTAAVGLTVATAGVGGVVMLSVLPAQTLTAAAAVGALAYTGKRRADGKTAIPFTDQKKADKPSEAAKSAEPAPAAA